jgi:hypothetical protein
LCQCFALRVSWQLWCEGNYSLFWTVSTLVHAKCMPLIFKWKIVAQSSWLVLACRPRSSQTTQSGRGLQVTKQETSTTRSVLSPRSSSRESRVL